MPLTQEQFDELRKKGLSVEQIIAFENGEKPDTRSFGRKAFDFITQNEQRLGQTYGDAIAVNTKDYKSAMESQAGLNDSLQRLGKKIAEDREAGKDTSKLERTYKNLSGSRFEAGEIAPSVNKNLKQIAGESLGVATDILGAGSLHRKGASVMSKPGFIGGAWQGIKSGASGGAIFGGADSAFRAMQDDAELMDIAKSGLTGALIGAGAGGALGGSLGGLGGTFVSKQIRRMDLENAVKKGELGGVKFKKIDTGAIKPATTKDKTAIKAINAGFDPRQVNMVKTSSINDRVLFREMVDIAERASDDLSVVDRPIDVTGKTILERVNYLTKKQKSNGKKLDAAIRNLPKEPIELNQLYNDFFDDLTTSGIRARADGTLDFRNSIYKNDNKAKSILQEVYNDIRPNSDGDVLRTPERIVAIRRKIFNDLDLGKKSNEVTSTLDALVTRVRKNLLDELSDLSDDFATANMNNAKIQSQLDRFRKLMGKDFDLSGDLANIKTGEISRRLLGNAKYKPYSIMKDLEDVAVEMGYTKKNDIIKQAQFAQLLEDLYDLVPQTSLQGQVGKGVENALEGMSLVGDIARKDVLGVFSKAFKKIKGVTPEKQKALLKELIKEGEK